MVFIPRWLASAALLLLGMSCFGSATPVSKLVGQELPLLMAAGLRMTIAAALLLPFAYWREGGLFTLSRRDWLLVLGVAIIGNIGFSAAMLYGMQWVSGVLGSIIMSHTPAITALAAVLFLDEQMNKRKILALSTGLAGVFIMQLSGTENSDGSHTWLGALLVFLAICCEATYTLMGKVATKHMTPLKLTTLSALIASLLMSPLVLYEGISIKWHTIAWQDWAALGWWGAGTMALGSMLWYSGVAKVPGHVAAAFMAVMPISALLLSYLLLAEAFAWMHIVGFGLAFIGISLMVREHQKQSQNNST